MVNSMLRCCVPLLVITLVGAQGMAHAEQYVFPYTEKVKTNDELFNYSKEILKKDILIFGDIVSIDSAIMSNGGDILVVANELVLSAPIDTRVHFSMVEPYWIPNDPQSANNSQLSLDRVFMRRPDLWRPIQARILWHDHFDSSSRKYTFGSHKHDAWFADSQRLDGYGYAQLMRLGLPAWDPIEIAQMPSGRTPRKTTFIRNTSNLLPGRDAPVITNKEVARSGDITIVASSINFCEVCGDNRGAYTLVDNGDIGDVERAIFFHAGGLKGGHGGLGHVNGWCVYARGANCSRGSSYTNPGANSGAPSAGGDGGDISFYLINPSDEEAVEKEREFIESADDCKQTFRNLDSRSDTENGSCEVEGLGQSLAWLSEVSGGYPPYWNERKRTNSVENLARTTERSLPAFSDVAVEDGPIEEVIGLDGQISIHQGDSRLALSIIGRELLRMELFGLYEYSEAIRYQQINSELSNVVFSADEPFARFLEKTIVELQEEIANIAVAELRGAPPNSNMELPALFQNLSCNAIDGNVSNTIRPLLVELCRFTESNGSTDPLSSFSANSGGLIAPITDGIASRIEGRARNASFRQVLSRLESIELEAIKIRSLLENFRDQQSEKDILAKVRALKTRLEALEAERDKANSSGALRNSDDLGDFVESAGKAVAAYNTSNWSAFVSETSKAYLSLRSDEFDQLHDIPAVREALRRAISAQDELREEIQRRHARYLVDQDNGISEIYSLSNEVTAIKRSLVYDFPHILRAAVLSELAYPSKNAESARANLEGYFQMGNSFPALTRALNLQEQIAECGTDSSYYYVYDDWVLKWPFSEPSCLKIHASESKRIVVAESEKAESSWVIVSLPETPNVVNVPLPSIFEDYEISVFSFEN